MDSAVLITVAAFLLVSALIKWFSRTGRKSPPGPWTLPIVGYIPFLSPLPHLDFQRLAKKYGNIYRIQLGSHQVIILNDFKSIKDAFTQDVFIGRPPETPFDINKITIETEAIIGLPWKEQRKFSLHMLGGLGLGKSWKEEQIQEEIAELLGHYEQSVDKPIFVRDLLTSSTSNNIATLVFGKRMSYDDPNRKMLSQVLNETSLAAGQVTWLVFFPWVKKLCKLLNIGIVDKVPKVQKRLRMYVWKQINEHEATLNPNSIRDYIDGYLLEIQKRKDEPSFNKRTLQDMVGAFFGPGSETVRATVEWLLLSAAAHQEEQQKVQAEIDEVIGPYRLPLSTDKKFMPYTEAFITELMRWRTLIPLNIINIIRYTLDDTELGGYFIPKHTRVLSNLWAVHHDAEYWGKDVEEFRPDRFLSEDGKVVKKWEQHIPYSIGKRACPGEFFANVEVFLYFTSILQKFSVRLPEGKTADFEGELGIGLQPKRQEIIMTSRN